MHLTYMDWHNHLQANIQRKNAEAKCIHSVQANSENIETA